MRKLGGYTEREVNKRSGMGRQSAWERETQRLKRT